MIEIKKAKDLENLFKLCRKHGIDAFEMGPIKFNLGVEPLKQKRYKVVPEQKTNPVDPLAPGGITDRLQVPLPNVPRYEAPIPTDALTEEEMLFYSVQNENQS